MNRDQARLTARATILTILASVAACRAGVDAQPQATRSSPSHSTPASVAPRPAPGTSLRVFEGGAPVASADVVVVALHGYGGSARPLLGRLVEATRPLSPSVAVVTPDGRLPRTEGGRMWWDIDLLRVRAARANGGWPQLERDAPPGLDESRADVLALLRELVARGARPERIVLAGFSQGAMLTVETALHHPDAVGGIVVWSGAVVNLDAWRSRRVSSLPAVVVHGRIDDVLPFSQGERLFEVLQGQGADARLVAFNGPHTVAGQGIAALREMIARVAR